jgi:hypothetical protein
VFEGERISTHELKRLATNADPVRISQEDLRDHAGIWLILFSITAVLALVLAYLLSSTKLSGFAS